MRILRDLLLNPILSLAFAVLLLGVGVFGVAGWHADREMTEHLARLPAAGTAAPGAAAYLEGRIVAEQPARHDGLVAWLREEYRSCGDTSCWTETEGEAPQLLVQDRAAQGWSVGAGYALATTADTVVEAPPGWTRGSVRSRGFVAGRALVAVGRVAADGGSVEADVVYAGTYAGVLAERRRAEAALPWFAGMAAAGVLLLGTCAWQVRRFLRGERRVSVAVGETAVPAGSPLPPPSARAGRGPVAPRGQRTGRRR